MRQPVRSKPRHADIPERRASFVRVPFTDTITYQQPIFPANSRGHTNVRYCPVVNWTDLRQSTTDDRRLVCLLIGGGIARRGRQRRLMFARQLWIITPKALPVQQQLRKAGWR